MPKFPSQLEALEIPSDAELINELTQSSKEAKKGRMIPWKKVKIPV